jgi:hypothetical protein
MVGFVLRKICRRVLETAFENSVKAIEARNGAARGSRILSRVFRFIAPA